jgi:polyribonucleotide nucleotidyltransferase
MSTIITKRQFPNYHKYEMDLAGRPLTLEVGKLAELANAAVMVGYGDTRVLVCATASARPRDGIDFFPLSVDFEEKLYSVGRIPGSFNRREGRPGEKGILTSRVIDRPIRPLFPYDFRNDVSVMCTVMAVASTATTPQEWPCQPGSRASQTHRTWLLPMRWPSALKPRP